MDSDRELLDAWVNGDKNAGRLLFERHFEMVRRFFVNKVNEPEDLIQSTFLACSKSRAQYRGDAAFRAYLLGIARNVLLKHWRDRTKRTHVDIVNISLADIGMRPSSHVARAEVAKRLLQALRQLPLDDQILLELYYWEEMKGQELALTMELRYKTAATRLRRAQLKLGTIMRQLESSEGAPETSDADIDAWARSVRRLVLDSER